VRSLRFLSSAMLYLRSFTFSCRFLLLAYSCCFSACRESTCALSSSASRAGSGQSSPHLRHDFQFFPEAALPELEFLEF